MSLHRAYRVRSFGDMLTSVPGGMNVDWFYPSLRLRSMLSVLANAVLTTTRAVKSPMRPMNAMKMSVVEKLDQVSMRVV